MLGPWTRISISTNWLPIGPWSAMSPIWLQASGARPVSASRCNSSSTDDTAASRTPIRGDQRSRWASRAWCSTFIERPPTVSHCCPGRARHVGHHRCQRICCSVLIQPTMTYDKDISVLCLGGCRGAAQIPAGTQPRSGTSSPAPRAQTRTSAVVGSRSGSSSATGNEAASSAASRVRWCSAVAAPRNR